MHFKIIKVSVFKVFYNDKNWLSCHADDKTYNAKAPWKIEYLNIFDSFVMSKLCIVKVVPHGRGPSVDPEIGRQRTESLAKDQEARHKVGKQPLCVLITLI